MRKPLPCTLSNRRRGQSVGIFLDFGYDFAQDVLAGIVLRGIADFLFRRPDNVFVAGLVIEPCDAFGHGSPCVAAFVFDDIAGVFSDDIACPFPGCHGQGNFIVIILIAGCKSH